MSERVEVRAEALEHRTILPGNLGYECTFYYGIRWRTAYLRERLYVTVEVEGHEFRPNGAEHFPADECFWRQGMNAGLGAGAPVEVLFRCYAPVGSGGAEEGVRAIAAALEELAERVNLGHWSRSMAVAVDNRRYLGLVGFTGMHAPPAYRPPPSVVPKRKPTPIPPIPEKTGPTLNERLVELWRSWGLHELAEDYEWMQQQRRREATMQQDRTQASPWKESFWT